MRRWIILNASVRTSCFGPSSRTRSFQRSVTWLVRASWRTWASFAASMNTSACRCRSCILAQAQRSSTPPRPGSLPSTTFPIEDLQPQDESALNRLLQSQLPKNVEEALSEAEDSSAEPWSASSKSMPEVDPTLAGAAKTTLGRMEHDLKGLRSKDDPRGEEARRDSAPPVRARAGADLPSGTSPGAHARRRVLPEPLRTGACRQADRRSFPWSWGNTGSSPSNNGN